MDGTLGHYRVFEGSMSRAYLFWRGALLELGLSLNFRSCTLYTVFSYPSFERVGSSILNYILRIPIKG